MPRSHCSESMGPQKPRSKAGNPRRDPWSRFGSTDDPSPKPGLATRGSQLPLSGTSQVIIKDSFELELELAVEVELELELKIKWDWNKIWNLKRNWNKSWIWNLGWRSTSRIHRRLQMEPHRKRWGTITRWGVITEDGVATTTA